MQVALSLLPKTFLDVQIKDMYKALKRSDPISLMVGNTESALFNIFVP